MKLSDFIDGALTEIVNGIRSAQEKDKEHGDIAAGGAPHRPNAWMVISARR